MVSFSYLPISYTVFYSSTQNLAKSKLSDKDSHSGGGAAAHWQDTCLLHVMPSFNPHWDTKISIMQISKIRKRHLTRIWGPNRQPKLRQKKRARTKQQKKRFQLSQIGRAYKKNLYRVVTNIHCITLVTFTLSYNLRLFIFRQNLSKSISCPRLGSNLQHSALGLQVHAIITWLFGELQKFKIVYKQ